MGDSVDRTPHSSKLGLLFRVKARATVNRVRQAVSDAPIRVSTAVLLTCVIWYGLYFLFRQVFIQFDRTPLEATVAIPLVFNFFFVAMLVLLTFSNALIGYAALFGKTESTYLLSAPITALDVVTLKYLESLVLASWSLILLGLPLMLAMVGRVSNPSFHFLFLAFFLAFIPIPGALGLMAAWIAARFFPRRILRIVAVFGGLMIGAAMVAAIRSLQLGDTPAEVWLQSFLSRMSFVEFAFLPNHWVSRGIDHAMQGRLSESLLYLGVTVANALFVSWIAVRLVARNFDQALDRACAGRDRSRRPAALAARGFCGWTFWYLPLPMRLIAAKDLRTFFRDPLQWSQLVILFGLMALYLTNMPTLQIRMDARGWILIVPFLNLCTVSLILATFTCRFVFPLLSLEGRNMWFIGLLPMPRGHVLLAKLAFAMTVTFLVGGGSILLSALMLEMNLVWAVVHMLITVSICFGLCGFAVGIGARLPMFGQSNIARIANGLGGTMNLLASLALVAVVMVGVGLATWRSRDLMSADWPSTSSLVICAGAASLSIIGGAGALWMGTRHFNRIEV